MRRRDGADAPNAQSMQTADSVPGTRLTPIQWLICAIAAIGFAFDIYELLMLPLIVAAGAAAS